MTTIPTGLWNGISSYTDFFDKIAILDKLHVSIDIMCQQTCETFLLIDFQINEIAFLSYFTKIR